MRLMATMIVLATAGFWASTAAASEFSGKPYTGGDVFADTWVATDGAGRVDTRPGGVRPTPGRQARRHLLLDLAHRRGRRAVRRLEDHCRRARRPGEVARIARALPLGRAGTRLLRDDRPVRDPEAREHAGRRRDRRHLLRHDQPALHLPRSTRHCAGNTRRCARKGPDADHRVHQAVRRSAGRSRTSSGADLYKPGLWNDLWFLWKASRCCSPTRSTSRTPVLDFFTFRRHAGLLDRPTGPDQWSWLEVYPQHASETGGVSPNK